MDNKQKIAVIAVLAAVVVLFVVALVISGGPDDRGDANSISSDRDGLLAKVAGDPATVRPDELSGNCQIQGTQITVNTACGLVVAPSDQRMRVVRLRSVNGIDVSAPAPEDADFDIDKDLEPGDEIAVAVDSDGATIELGCGFGQTCTLTLLGSQT